MGPTAQRRAGLPVRKRGGENGKRQKEISFLNNCSHFSGAEKGGEPCVNHFCGRAGTLKQRIRAVEPMADSKMDQPEERLTRLTQEETTSENRFKEDS